MNKFIIKKPKKTTCNCKEEKQSYEIYNFTKEENSFVDKALLCIDDKGSIHLSDELGIKEQLLYLVFDLKGMDPLLDRFFKDPTEEFVKRMKGEFTINDDTKEIVRKRLHNYLYHHLITYDYDQLMKQ